ncbi:MAG: hypothetical protein KatS3mg024_2079 [Armatimonadota bacterium]|nr:MAG: hypothetical protein KatS3mg024_2079 [Armatimonadota bacterium]
MLRLALVAGLALLLDLCADCRADTVLVTPSNMQGWVAASADGKVTGDPRNYPAQGEFRESSPPGNPLGPGAYNMQPGGGLDIPGQVWLGTDAYNGVYLRDITRLTYWHYTKLTGNNPPNERVSQPPNLQLLVTRDGINYRYFIHMPWGTPTWENGELRNDGIGPLSDYGAWKMVDCMTQGVWWDPYGGDWGGTWSELLQRYPLAQLKTPVSVGNTWGAAQTLTGCSLNFEWGGRKVTDRVTGPWWKEGYWGDAFIDAFTIGVNGVETTYDFDVAPRAEVILNNRATRDPIISDAKNRFVFTVFGKVDFNQYFTADTFTVDDGSGRPVLVRAFNHGVNPFEYVKATGTLDNTKEPVELTTTADRVTVLSGFAF